MSRVRTPRFQHSRLALFFVLVALSGAAVGVLVLRLTASRTGPEPAWWAIAATAVAAGALGFGGVLYHRTRVLHEKFRETEAYLRAIERESAKYRALLEGAADMVVVLDTSSGTVIETNVRAREVLGSSGDLVGHIDEADSEALRDALARAAAEPGVHQSIQRVRVRSAVGGALDCEARLAAVELADRRVVHVALRDRTRELAIERELAVRERLSSLGLVTAGVAHEINNPLEGIGNYVNLLGRPDLSAEDRARHLEMVRHGFGRVRDLVRDLLRFARPSATRDEVDLRAVVERAHRLAAFSEGFRAVRVELAGFDAPLVVTGDAGRLEQVVFNLLLNAAAAMQGSGRVAISARRDVPNGQRIAITIADEGPGIPPANLERIFDPFFTTGGGSGLGLSVAFGILQAHGGVLSARNRPEGGAEFTMQFPDPAPGSIGDHA